MLFRIYYLAIGQRIWILAWLIYSTDTSIFSYIVFLFFRSHVMYDAYYSLLFSSALLLILLPSFEFIFLVHQVSQTELFFLERIYYNWKTFIWIEETIDLFINTFIIHVYQIFSTLITFINNSLKWKFCLVKKFSWIKILLSI